MRVHDIVILAPQSNLDQTTYLAQQLCQLIAANHFTEVGHKTASFGVASYREGDTEDTMTKRADDCLYLAREQGRNRVVNEENLKGINMINEL